MEPLGMSQVWQYVKYLSKEHKIIILSFEKSDDLSKGDALNLLKEEIDSYDVYWHPITYHKKPRFLATTYDILHAIFTSALLIKKYNVEIIHSRSYIPSIIAFFMKFFLHIKYIFDMRGFWADEKIDSGVWKKKSIVYRVVKKIERHFFLNADVIVSLTNTGKRDIQSLNYMLNVDTEISVIPTCTNLNIFKPRPKPNKNKIKIKKHGFILGYVGSVETFYLFDEVLKSFLALLAIDSNAKLLVINRNQHEYIKGRMFNIGVDMHSVELKSSPYKKIPDEINRMDAGIFYIKPSFSKRSSSPTRMGEFLGCGKPCMSNFGVGDTESVLEGENVGIVLKSFSESEHMKGINRLLELVKDKNIQERCTHVAKEHFSLGLGVEKYNNIYKQLVDK